MRPTREPFNLSFQTPNPFVSHTEPLRSFPTRKASRPRVSHTEAAHLARSLQRLKLRNLTAPRSPFVLIGRAASLTPY